MKSKLLIFGILFFSSKLMAQFKLIQPEVFSLEVNENASCKESETGKIFYNSNINMLAYCIGDVITGNGVQYWEGMSEINYAGKVGIGKNSPSNELDINGDIGFNALSVNGQIGIGTNTPSEKLELVDRSLRIKSTTDVNSWTLKNSDLQDRLEFVEMSVVRMVFEYGGNICIGCSSPSINTFRVLGNVSYTGDLSVGGKGILVNNNANQLVMTTVKSSVTAYNIYILGNTCLTIDFSFPPNIFSSTPAVFLGQNLSVIHLDRYLVKSIIDVTSKGGKIQICNIESTGVAFSDQSYSLTAIGK